MGDYLMSLIKCNDIQNASGGIPTVKGQKLIPTAWVNFKGTATAAIRDSENVSSITDEETGQFLVNFSTTMANTNFCAVYSTHQYVTWSGTTGNDVNITATGFVQVVHRENGNKVDSNQHLVIVLGGQA